MQRASGFSTMKELFAFSRNVRRHSSLHAALKTKTGAETNPNTVPAWDVTLPYTIHGRPKSAIIDQGYGLSFFKPNPNLRDSNAVGATSVTYDFMSPNRNAPFFLSSVLSLIVNT